MGTNEVELAQLPLLGGLFGLRETDEFYKKGNTP